MAIGTMVYKAVMDTSSYRDEAKALRAENASVRRSLRESEPAAEKAAKSIDHLEAAHRRGTITSEEYSRAIEHEQRKLEAATGATDGFASKFSKANVAMLAAAGGAAVVATAMTGVRIAVDGVSESLERLAEKDKHAQSLGVSVNELDRWAYAARQAGLDAEESAEVFRDLRVKIGEAATGSGDAADQFKLLGLNAQDLATKSPAEALYDISDAFAANADGAKEAAIADALLSDAGVALLPILNQGSEGLERMAERSDDISGSLEKWELANISQANEAINNASAAVDGLWNRLAVELAPTITIVANGITELAKDTRKWVEDAEDAAVSAAGYAGALHDLYEMANLVYGFNPGAILEEDALSFDRASEYANKAADQIQAAKDKLANDPITPAAGDDAVTDKLDSGVKARMRAVQREIDIAEYGAEAVEMMELRKAGATDREIAMLEELQDIRREQIAEIDRVAEAEKRREDAAKDAAKQRVAAEQQASQAIAAARKALADREKADAKMRADIAKGPGAGNEAGTNAAVAYLADMRNAEIAKQVMPAKPEAEATQEQLAAEANRQLQQINQESSQQTQLTQQLLKATEENRVRRVR